MKKLLISTSIAALMASNSMVSFASSLAVPNDFTSGTKAVAQEVNDNFTAVETSVNDNNTRIGQNETDIVTNAQDIAALQGGGTTCPTEMTAVGSLCVDLYEASVYEEATFVNKVPAGAVSHCQKDGSDCGKGAPTAGTTAIYARSAEGETPNDALTWYQAVQACANVGKRLPTTAEWQAAAAGTPPNSTDASTPCNNGTGTLALTGSIQACKSNIGAFDMVGNLMEWSADLELGGTSFTDTDSMNAYAMGESNVRAGSAKSIYVPPGGPSAANEEIGFRCVK